MRRFIWLLSFALHRQHLFLLNSPNWIPLIYAFWPHNTQPRWAHLLIRRQRWNSNIKLSNEKKFNLLQNMCFFFHLYISKALMLCNFFNDNARLRQTNARDEQTPKRGIKKKLLKILFFIASTLRLLFFMMCWGLFLLLRYYLTFFYLTMKMKLKSSQVKWKGNFVFT